MAKIHFIGSGKKDIELDEKDVIEIDELVETTNSKTIIQALRTAINITLTLYREAKKGKKILLCDEKNNISELKLPD